MTADLVKIGAQFRKRFWLLAAATLATTATGSPSPAVATEKRLQVYLTGYTYWDNTPPGSSIIALPVIHRKAGGSGTYANPITLAAGHVIEGSKHSIDYPAGTTFYFPNLRKYAIVEDYCGDGPTPQNGPCHIGYRQHPWLDIYVGGASMTAAEADICSRDITGIQTAIINPRSGYPVNPGELATHCETFR